MENIREAAKVCRERIDDTAFAVHRGEVYHRVDLKSSGELIPLMPVEYIETRDSQSRPSLHEAIRSSATVRSRHDIMTRFKKGSGRMRADEAETAGYKDHNSSA